MNNIKTQQQLATENAEFSERVKGGLLAAAGLLIFNPRMIALGVESVRKPEVNNFGSF